MSYSPPPGQYQPPYSPVPPDHPRATTALVLGIVSLVLCQLLGPVAWAIGGSTVKEIDASNGQLGGRGTAQAGRICGIVATVILVLLILTTVALLVLGIGLISQLDGCTTVTDPDGSVRLEC